MNISSILTSLESGWHSKAFLKKAEKEINRAMNPKTSSPMKMAHYFERVKVIEKRFGEGGILAVAEDRSCLRIVEGRSELKIFEGEPFMVELIQL